MCLCLLAVSAVAAPGPVRPMPPLELERFVDGVVADGMAADHVAGVTVSIVQGGRVVLVKGYGQSRPGQAVDANRDLFRIGSISKTFTWIALMREVERERIRLDAPVNDYLPPDLKVPDQGFKRPIRIVDLMSHATGFEVVDRNHLAVDHPEDVLPLAEELRRHRPHRVREPGLLSSYSNYGAALAGLIVARSAGRPFEDLVDRDLTGPLGMSSTTFREPYLARPGLPAPMPADLARRMAVGFEWKDGAFKPRGFEYLSQNAPGGSASTTAPDMARYMLMQLNGGVLGDTRIYGPETAIAFRTPIMKAPEGVNGWAHGLMIRTLPGGYLSYGHGGSLDRFFSNLSLIPELDLGVFISTNTSTGRRLSERLPKLIVERFYAPAGARPVRPGDPGLLSRAHLYEGRYITTRRAYGGLEELADLLASHDRVWVTPEGYLKTKLDTEVRSWTPDGPAGHFVDAYGTDKLVFTRDAHGRATGFPFPRGTYTAQRAAPWFSEAPFRLSAALALCAALATLCGAVLRQGRHVQTPGWQARFDRLGLAVAAAWLIAFGAFWRSGLADGSLPDSGFPGPWLLTASWAALFATGGSLMLGALYAPAVCTGGEGGWTLPRKAGRWVVVAAYLAFGALLGFWGGLAPWA